MSSKGADNLNRNELIHQIVYLVKNKRDYNQVANIMLNNLITIEQLNQYTLKLSQLEIAKIADSIISTKR